ncbi:MAG: N-acetyltransferase [Bacteroidales bacterium]|nr:N-acetyltransferase [Bacteroidales bacterium]
MAVTIQKVASKSDLRKFIRFNYELYKHNDYSVPDLYIDMVRVFDRKKNPAFEFCEADYFLAYKDGRLVGRVAAILNHRANETWHTKTVRFGWIDFIDDLEVSAALIQTVTEWGLQRGMTTLVGPMGFTDMDAEGMLIEGFEELSTMATIYNYPYYLKHMERIGLEKEIDWVEYKLMMPDVLPEKYKRVSEIVMKRYNLKIKKLTRSEVRHTDYPQRIFDLINEAYAPLYGYSRMTQRQIDQYVKEWFPVIDLRMVTLVENTEGDIVGVGISMPSMSEALQKSKGRLFPFGWYYFAKALFLKRPKMLDLLLVAVKPEYQNKGVNALLFYDLIPIFQKMGFEYGETNPELESNERVQAQWQHLDMRQHKRRRAFRKTIATDKDNS